ncbi:hypothetical protein NDU88_006834 [Pleurodeles waltl]|uniref:Uncharacterized protein n=1 Tax=Pleurodeles waltl TaxID=8319 RepID=A0AAV7SQU4_PLEWA|nr:hypothetical protein NDU88_006834 [Pleurodeles waltl]
MSSALAAKKAGLGPRCLLEIPAPTRRVGLSFCRALSDPPNERQCDTQAAIPMRGDPAVRQKLLSTSARECWRAPTPILLDVQVGWLDVSRVECFYLGPTRDQSYLMGKPKPAKTPVTPMEMAGMPAGDPDSTS